MAIITSEIVSETPYGDGRFTVKERHVDHLAKEYIIEYLADLGVDVQAKLAEHAESIWENCMDNEIRKWISKLEDGTLPDPSLINLDYAPRLDLLRQAIKWAVRQHAVEALKAIILVNYVKNNYNTTQIASFLGVSSDVVNAFLARFNILSRDLQPLLDDDATKIVEL